MAEAKPAPTATNIPPASVGRDNAPLPGETTYKDGTELDRGRAAPAPYKAATATDQEKAALIAPGVPAGSAGAKNAAAFAPTHPSTSTSTTRTIERETVNVAKDHFNNRNDRPLPGADEPGTAPAPTPPIIGGTDNAADTLNQGHYKAQGDRYVGQGGVATTGNVAQTGPIPAPATTK